jgi:uncharacterized protein (DUF58 family)
VAPRLAISSDALRQFDRLAFASRRRARGGLGGEHASRRPAPSTDFIDYRPYQPGDDFRRVDWNVYGRLGSLQVKVTEGRERLDVLLVLDCSGSMAFGTPDCSKLGVGAELVAALAYIGAARSDAVRIECLGRPPTTNWLSRPFGRRSQAHELLRQLSSLTPAGMVDLDTALAECLTGDVPRDSLAVVVSDLLTPDGAAAGLDALRARVADVTVVHLVSPEELEPRLSGEVELIDEETGAALEIGVSMDTLAAYRARLQAWLDARADACHRRGMRYIRARTDRPLASLVLDDLRRGGLLR